MGELSLRRMGANTVVPTAKHEWSRSVNSNYSQALSFTINPGMRYYVSALSNGTGYSAYYAMAQFFIDSDGSVQTLGSDSYNATPVDCSISGDTLTITLAQTKGGTWLWEANIFGIDE